jgi:hypothetical protein
MMILKMLEEGKITSDEAAALIDALDEATQAEPGFQGGRDDQGYSGEDGRKEAEADGEDDGGTGGGQAGKCAEKRESTGTWPDLSKINALADRLAQLAETSCGPVLESLAGHIEKVMERAVEEKERAMKRIRRARERTAERSDDEGDSGAPGCPGSGQSPLVGETFAKRFIGTFAPGVEVRKTFEGAFDGSCERVAVEAATSNGSIAVEPCDGPGFSVEIRARARGAGVDPSSARSMLEEAIDYKAGPGNLRIACCCGRAVSGASLVIRLPRRFRYDLELETSNGKVEIGALECGTISVETSNGRIDLDGTSSADAELETSNGRINHRGTAKRLAAETSNGSILVVPTGLTGEAFYELHTSNGSIQVLLDAGGGVGCRVDARTSQGAIRLALPDLAYQVNTKSMGHEEIVAATPGYEASVHKVMIKAETSNGSITILGGGEISRAAEGSDAPEPDEHR